LKKIKFIFSNLNLYAYFLRILLKSPRESYGYRGFHDVGSSHRNIKVDSRYASCQRHVNINVMSGISSSRFYDQIFICPKLKAIETAFAIRIRHDQS